MEAMLNGIMAIINYGLYRAFTITLVILMSLCALISIIIVVIQPGNSSGIDALGGSSETFFSKNKGKSKEAKMKIVTAVCLGLLALFSILFFVVELLAK